MKTTLPLHHLFRTFFLCLICCASLSVFAQDDSGDGGDPPINPPTLPIGGGIVASSQGAATMSIVFTEDMDEVQVEVSDPTGATVFTATGGVKAYARLLLDTQRWKRGTYTLRLKVKGRPVHTSTVQLR